MKTIKLIFQNGTVATSDYYITKGLGSGKIEDVEKIAIGKSIYNIDSKIYNKNKNPEGVFFTFKIGIRIASIESDFLINNRMYENSVIFHFCEGVLVDENDCPVWNCLAEQPFHICVISDNDIYSYLGDNPIIDEQAKSYHPHTYTSIRTEIGTNLIKKVLNKLNLPLPPFMWKPKYHIIKELEGYVDYQLSFPDKRILKLIELGYTDYAFCISKNTSSKTIEKRFGELINVSKGRSYSKIPEVVLKAVNYDVIKANLLLNCNINNQEKLTQFKEYFTFSYYNISTFSRAVEIIMEELKCNKEYAVKEAEVCKLFNKNSHIGYLEILIEYYDQYKNLYFMPKDWCKQLIRLIKCGFKTSAQVFWCMQFVKSLNSFEYCNIFETDVYDINFENYIRSFPYAAEQAFQRLNIDKTKHNEFLLFGFTCCGTDVFIKCDYTTKVFHVVCVHDGEIIFYGKFTGGEITNINDYPGSQNSRMYCNLVDDVKLPKNVICEINETFSERYREYTMRQLVA